MLGTTHSEVFMCKQVWVVVGSPEASRSSAFGRARQLSSDLAVLHFDGDRIGHGNGVGVLEIREWRQTVSDRFRSLRDSVKLLVIATGDPNVAVALTGDHLVRSESA